MSSGPTIVDNPNFDAVESAHALFKAVDGIGTNENVIIDIITSCSNKQRQEIKKQFQKIYRKDLVKEFKSEILIRFSFDFKQLLESMFMTPLELDTHLLKHTTKGLGTDEKALVEILLTRSAEEMIQIKDEYMKRFRISLEDDVADDTSGDFRKFVFPLCRAKRRGVALVNLSKARDVAAEINDTFTQYRGTDTPRFDFIGFCCCENFKQIKATVDEYEKLTDEVMIDFIENEFHGDAAYALKSAIKCSNSMPGFFAERLYKSMEGIATNDEALIRILVCRSEIDLEEIKREFENRYGKTLESKIKSHTSRQFKQLLLAILRGNVTKEAM
ncbi:annexin A13-like [Ciona intestinalis]